MSVMRCDGCGQRIDTDFHEMVGDYCERCAEEQQKLDAAQQQEDDDNG